MDKAALSRKADGLSTAVFCSDINKNTCIYKNTRN